VGKAKRAHRLLAERPLYLLHIASPIRRKQTAFDITTKAAMRPIGHARNVSVLHRIEVDVIDMTLKIRIIANGVLPVPALPDAFFPFGNLAC
jgi:hypothetical protein